MSLEKEINIFGRHSIRSDGSLGRGNLESGDSPSEKYPSLTEKGEKLTRETVAKEYPQIIESMNEDGILFLGGSSEEERTKATAEITGDELTRIYSENEDILVFDKEKLSSVQEKAKRDRHKFLDKVKELVESNKEKKIIFSYPMFLKEFSIRPHFRDKETGEHTEYSKELLKKYDYDEQKAVIDWFENQGKLEVDGDSLSSESPEEIAKNHIKGINRLREFAQGIVGDRQVCIGITGHGWNVDALAMKYASEDGKIDVGILADKFNNEMINMAEMGWVEIKDGKSILHYKNEIKK